MGPRDGSGEVAASDFVPVLAVGDPQDNMGYVASHLVHLWAPLAQEGGGDPARWWFHWKKA